MKPHGRALARCWPAALAAAFMACGADFDPASLLNSLRVLAIRTEPVDPAPGETSIATPLVYSPDGQAVTYSWSWCPLPGAADDGYPCLVDQATLSGLAAANGVNAGSIPPLDLGTGPTAALPHTIDPKLLEALCSGALPGVPRLTDCKDGFPVQLRVKVRLADGSDEVDAIRTLHLRLENAAPPNLNPVIDGLSAAVPCVSGPIDKFTVFTRPGFARVCAYTPIDDGAAVTLPHLRKTTIRAQVLETEAQAYFGRDERDQPVDTRERLFISWFVETGDVHRRRTTYIAGEIPIQTLLTNDWRPAGPKDHAETTAQLIAILRDSRGGVSWRSAIVRLGAVE